jgi:hypothetical protein
MEVLWWKRSGQNLPYLPIFHAYLIAALFNAVKLIFVENQPRCRSCYLSIGLTLCILDLNYIFDSWLLQVLSSDDPKYGYNAATGKYEDLMAAGIIDPTKVTS